MHKMSMETVVKMLPSLSRASSFMMSLRVHADRNVFVGKETDLITHISAVERSIFAFFEKHVTEPKPVKVLRTFYGGDQFRFLSPSMSRLAQVDAKASWLPEVCCQLGNDPRVK